MSDKIGHIGDKSWKKLFPFLMARSWPGLIFFLLPMSKKNITNTGSQGYSTRRPLVVGSALLMCVAVVITVIVVIDFLLM